MKKIALNLIVISNVIIASSVQAVTNAALSSNSTTAWSGFYGGINLGYTTPNIKRTGVNGYNIQQASQLSGPEAATAAIASSTGSSSLKYDGFIGGGQIGYSRNVYSSFVAGFEADIQGIAGGKQHASSDKYVNIAGFDNPPTGISSHVIVSKNTNYLGTVRARLGYLITPAFLFSGTAGFAYGGVSSKTNIAQSINIDPATAFITTQWSTAGNYSKTRTGVTIGGNFEWMIHQNWSTKIEYLYYDLGKVTYNNGQLTNVITTNGGLPLGTVFFANKANTTTHFDGHIIRIGINYHFA